MHVRHDGNRTLIIFEPGVEWISSAESSELRR